MKTKPLDLDFVRRQFPAFSEASLKGTAFFENAGGSYMCRQVMDQLDRYVRQTKVQPFHPYPQAQQAGANMQSAYGKFSDWLNVGAEEIYFGPSTSQNTYVLAQAMLGWLKEGDEIIVTNQDHEANSGVFRRLAQQGILVKEWCVDANSGSLNVDHLPALFNKHTKLLVFPHCSNILGEINPVAHIASLARDKGVKTLVDGVSYAGHGLPDVDALGVDIYLFSLYKVYGTHQGVMVVRQQMDACLSNQGHYFNDHLREKRLTPAGPDHAQIAAAAGVCDYLTTLYHHHVGTSEAREKNKNKVVHDLLRQAEIDVLEPLLKFFNEHQKITLIGPKHAVNRAPTVSVLVKGHKAFDLASALGQKGLMCGAGHFYSKRLLQAMGIDAEEGVLRFSLVHYTSALDVTKLTQTLKALIV